LTVTVVILQFYVGYIRGTAFCRIMFN